MDVDQILAVACFADLLFITLLTAILDCSMNYYILILIPL